MMLSRSAPRGAALLLLLSSTAAFADTRMGAEASLSGGYSSNPYGGGLRQGGAGTATAAIKPSISLVSPTGITQISGDLSHTEFSRHYDAMTNYSASLSTSQQVSPRTSVTGRLGFGSRVVNALRPLDNPIIGEPGEPELPIIVDPAAADTFRQRVRSYNASASISQKLSYRDTLSFSANGMAMRYPEPGTFARDYDYYGGSVSYQRQTGQVTSIGGSLNLSRSDYLRSAFGDGTMITPSLTLATRLAPRMSFNASAGATFVSSTSLIGKRRTTSFSGNAVLCNEGERSTLCATLARGVGPSSLSGNSVQTSLGLNYNYKLSPRSSFNVGGSYARSSSLVGAATRKLDFGTASAGYDRRLSERLTAFAKVGYSDSFSSTVARRANFYGNVGVRYRFGDQR